jgi:hypothetical protein
MNEVEIDKVANGYMARPAYSSSNPPLSTNFDEIHVFESFTALAAWLQEQFEDSPKKGVTQ